MRKADDDTTYRATAFHWGWLWRGRLNRLQSRLAPGPEKPGTWGEWIALLHLRRLRWDVLARNWEVKRGELDLVAADGETLVFLEVKTRTGAIRPEENFTPRKEKQMASLADQFRARYEMQDRPFRCDLIAVETEDYRSFELRHWIL